MELLHYNAANHTPKNLLEKVKRKADKILLTKEKDSIRYRNGDRVT
jgi:hypothetical protein